MLGINPLEQSNDPSSCHEDNVGNHWPSIIMEAIEYGTDNFEVPSGLTKDFSYLLDIISPETWNNILTDEHRELLMKFLPDFPEDDLNEKTHTLEMFFMNKNFYFGSPLQKFFMDFKQGFFNPDIAKIRKIHRKILHKSYKYRQKKYFHNLLEEILMNRQEVFDGVRNQTADWKHRHLQLQNGANPISKSEACMQRASKRYFKELKSLKVEAGCDSDLSDDDNYSEGMGLSLNKKQKRQLFLLEASFPPHLCLVRSTHTKGSLALDLEAKLTSNKNPFDATEEQFRNLLSIHLANHKKKNCPSLDTRGLTLKSVLERSEMLARRPVQRPPPSPMNSAPSSRLHSLCSKKPPRKKLKLSPQVLPSLPLIAPEEIKRELSSDSLSSDGEVHDLDIAKDVCPSPATTPMEDIKPSLTAELTQETHLSFFSLLRDIVCSTPNQRMGRNQVISSISTWQESAISPLNEWFCLSDSWELILPSAINFLCGNIATDLLPCDFVPFIEHKSAPKHYQWIGAGRDSDANLEPLCQYWLSNRDKFSNDWSKDVTVSSDPEDSKSVAQNIVQKLIDIKPDPDVESCVKTEYHIQEKSRYEQPHKAFTYRMNGYESVIGPVKGVYTHQQSGSTTKARGHMLLVPDRPPFVTILSLVWDAVARLPNSEGTKMEICELLKASQFMVPINNPTLENALNVVVSGALDRLQNEKDPCVKFDTSRKLWVYLHKFRSEKELEMMHQLKLRSGSTKAKSQSSTRKVSKKKEEASLTQGPPNVTMEQFTPAIKQMDGSEIRIKDEDILKKWEKLSTTKGKRKEKSIKASALKQDAAAIKSINLGGVDKSSLPSGSQILPVYTTQTVLATSASVEEETPAASLPKEENLTTSCSAIQIGKGSPSLVQTTASSVSPTGSVKPLLQSQTSRKYQSSSERKKLLKAADGGRASPSSKVVSTSKAFTSQPSTSTTTVGTQQSKGIKLLQYSNPNLQAKGLVSNASLVMDTSTAVPALVGQKLVVAGNRVLVQGGKVLHNVAGASSRGKQVLAGMLPAQHIMAVNSIKKHSGEQQTVEGGRFIQIATVDAQGGYQKPTGYQKLTLVPQFTQATLSSGSGKAQDLSSLGLGKGSITTAGELKLKLGSAAFATAAGNIISLGGKQILLATKGGAGNRGTQIHQVVLGDSRTRVDVAGTESLRSGTSTQQIVVPVSASSQQSTSASVSVASQQVTATTSSGASQQQQRLTLSGQQIVVPASALAGSQLNLKRLQAFQSFKVVPASQLAQHQGSQRGKPVVAHILTQSPSTSTGAISTTKLALQIATSTATENTPEK